MNTPFEVIRDGRPVSLVLRPGSTQVKDPVTKQSRSVGKIGAGDDILDPIENDGSGGGKQNFVLIGE